MSEEIQDNKEITEEEITDPKNNEEDSSDLDTLASEMSDLSSEKTEFSKSGDLSSLITEKVDSDKGNIDEMLESAENSNQNLDLPHQTENGIDLNFLLKMPLTMTFEVGRAKMNVNDLLSLGQGSVLELHRLVGENLDLFINGKLIAQGEVVVSNERFGAKITEIISPEERVKKMGGMEKTN
tara:strand:- start:1984 stop:2529 length:546 start_codon:yes stop_codon:yes gene_type:complete